MNKGKRLLNLCVAVLAGTLVIKPISIELKNDGYFVAVVSTWQCLTMPVMRCVHISPVQRICAPSFMDVSPSLLLMGPNFDSAVIWGFLQDSALRQCAALDGGV